MKAIDVVKHIVSLGANATVVIPGIGTAEELLNSWHAKKLFLLGQEWEATEEEIQSSMNW